MTPPIGTLRCYNAPEGECGRAVCSEVVWTNRGEARRLHLLCCDEHGRFWARQLLERPEILDLQLRPWQIIE